MKIDYEIKTAYVIHEVKNSSVMVCKVLKKCSNKKEAINTLADLLSGNVSEEELLDGMEQIYQEEEM